MPLDHHPFFTEAPPVLFATTPIDIQRQVTTIDSWIDRQTAGVTAERCPRATDTWEHTSSIDHGQDEYVNLWTSPPGRRDMELPAPTPYLPYISIELARRFGMVLNEPRRRMLGLRHDYPIDDIPPAAPASPPVSASPPLVPKQDQRLKGYIDRLRTVYQDYKEFIVVEPLREIIDLLVEEQEAVRPLHPIPPENFDLTIEEIQKILSLSTTPVFILTDHQLCAGLLMYRFIWNETEQGENFWKTEHRHLRLGKHLSFEADTILRSWLSQLKAQVSA